MKKISYFLLLIFIASCTSNTIFEKPKDLIPKDTMSLLVQEMMLASSAQFLINKNLQKNINYMPFVYERFKIDSARFQASNLYYMSKIDDYQKIFQDAEYSLKKQKVYYDSITKRLDSIRKDSIKNIGTKKIDLKKDSISKDSIE